MLLSHGADPTIVNCHSKTAIDVAATQDLKEKLLYEYRGHTYLEAVRSADIGKIKRIISPELINFCHPLTLDSALHICAKSNSAKRERVAEFLIKRGCDVGLRNKEKLTPLHDSAAHGNGEVLEMLVKASSDINALDELMLTPLHHAAQAGRLEMSQFWVGPFSI